MTPEVLAEIRARAAEVDDGDGSAMPFVSQAEKDRHALLAYIDELDRQIRDIGAHVGEVLEAARFHLALKLVSDGHAKNFGDGLRLAEDLDQVAKLYPDVA